MNRQHSQRLMLPRVKQPTEALNPQHFPICLEEEEKLLEHGIKFQIVELLVLAVVQSHRLQTCLFARSINS